MKRTLPSEPPPSLVAYELEPGKVLFVHSLPSVPVLEELTSTEQEVLGFLLDGHDTQTIASTRSTSPRTVANQVASIYRKLGVGSRAELAAKVLSPRSARQGG